MTLTLKTCWCQKLLLIATTKYYSPTSMSQSALAILFGARNMSAGVRKGMSKLRESMRACSEDLVTGSWGPLAPLKCPGCWFWDPKLLIWFCCCWNLGPPNCCWTPWEVRWALTAERTRRRRGVKWYRPIAMAELPILRSRWWRLAYTTFHTMPCHAHLACVIFHLME